MKTDLKAAVESITPDMAEEYATGKTHNRAKSDALIQKYLREMCDGRWRLNGEPIIFSDTGRLLDGQHRMNALHQYGKPLKFLVVRGVEEDAFTTIDTGSARKGKDVFSIKGISNPMIASAICKMCLQWEHGGGNLSKINVTFSNDELLKYFESNTEAISEGTRIANRPELRRRLCPTATGTLVVLCNREFPDLVERFLLGLETGANLSNGDPVLTLRNRLEREKEGLGRMALPAKFALLFKAWNAFVCDRSLPKLSYAPEKEKYPIPITTKKQRERML